MNSFMIQAVANALNLGTVTASKCYTGNRVLMIEIVNGKTWLVDVALFEKYIFEVFWGDA